MDVQQHCYDSVMHAIIDMWDTVVVKVMHTYLHIIIIKLLHIILNAFQTRNSYTKQYNNYIYAGSKHVSHIYWFTVLLNRIIKTVT